jgi:hypothetical protein
MKKSKLISDMILPTFWLLFIFAFVPVNKPGKKNNDKKLANVKTQFSINKSKDAAFLLYIKK